MPNNYICKNNLYVRTDKYVFSIDLAQHNRKKPSLNIRFAFCVNLGLASDLQGGLQKSQE